MAKKKPAKKKVKTPEKPKHFTPDLRLLTKLGSIAVHAEELLSPEGHPVDKTELEILLKDEEVKTWIEAMGPLLPLKRNQGVESLRKVIPSTRPSWKYS
jgi:hypothetical protein